LEAGAPGGERPSAPPTRQRTSSLHPWPLFSQQPGHSDRGKEAGTSPRHTARLHDRPSWYSPSAGQKAGLKESEGLLGRKRLVGFYTSCVASVPGLGLRERLSLHGLDASGLNAMSSPRLLVFIHGSRRGRAVG